MRKVMLSRKPTLGLASQSFSTRLGLLVLLVLIGSLPLFASKQSFTLPEDLALRIRLDDTLTSTDSQVGDPFSATVVDCVRSRKKEDLNAPVGEGYISASLVHLANRNQDKSLSC